MNLHSTVAEPVIVLRSKAKRTKRLLYLIGFEDEFVSRVLLENEGNTYEIVQKHQLHEISINSLVELRKNEGPAFALICDLQVLRKNNFHFIENVRNEETLKVFHS